MNYDLIGSMPKLDVFRNELPAMIAKFESGKSQAMLARVALTEAFKSGGPKAVSALVGQRYSDPQVMERVALGVTIELCAQHFYGIDTVALNSIDETIAAVKAADSELEFGQ
jgi:hypothetical protein